MISSSSCEHTERIWQNLDGEFNHSVWPSDAVKRRRTREAHKGAAAVAWHMALQGTSAGRRAYSRTRNKEQCSSP